MLSQLSPGVRQYLLVTGNYWAFTLTDGALRMLVVLHFHTLGYSPLEIALLFLFYEFFGVVTNLVGGWLGARIGLNRTMNIGLGLQVVALAMLLVPAAMLTVPWVMAAQALSGVAKDLNKMSAKSAIKLLIPDGANQSLYRWVAFLTGSKNSLKGAGFFLGGFLLWWLGFQGAVLAMATLLSFTLLLSLVNLGRDLGVAKSKPKFSQIFSKSGNINILSAARLFLFGARDLWFVVALPVYLSAELGWAHTEVSSFLALWVIGYGVVQSLAPYITGKRSNAQPNRAQTVLWSLVLLVPLLTLATQLPTTSDPGSWLVIGLLVFGALFAINSSLHSYLIVNLADRDAVSLDVGFYYMANAAGRLIGTLLSGYLYQAYGLETCLWGAALFILSCTLLSSQLKFDGFAKQ